MLILREQKYCMYLPTNIRTNSRAKAETHMDFCSFAISIDHCSSLAGEKGLLYVFKWRFGNFQKVSKFLKFGHYTKELEL